MGLGLGQWCFGHACLTIIWMPQPTGSCAVEMRVWLGSDSCRASMACEG